MKKAMTSKERVLTTLAGREADRVPVNYCANPGIDARLKKHFGLKPKDDEGLRRVLDVDFRGVGERYVGPDLHQDVPGRGIKVDKLWGICRRWIEHGSGGYWDYCEFPLKDATVEQIAEWPMPNPDHFDYGQIRSACERSREFAVYYGHAGLADVINSTGMLRGTEQVLVDLISDDPAGLLLIERRAKINLERTRRALEAAQGGIDFLWIGEDLGTQISPLISLELFRKHIKPIHKMYVDLAKSFNLPVMIHTCGSSSWAYEDFIELGVNAADTLQPEARNMSPEYLKTTFGGRLSFHGCISTAGPVSFGTPAEVDVNCRHTLEVMKPGGGYCFAPTHALQDNSPTENVLAMYEAPRKYGRFN